MATYLLAVNFSTEIPIEDVLKQAVSKKDPKAVEEEKKEGEAEA